MIQIPRSLARQLRAVFRKTVLVGSSSVRRPAVVFETGRDGLVVRSQSSQVAVEYRQPGHCESGRVAAPFDLLDRVQGRDESSMTIEESAPGKIVASWSDAGIPQAVEFDAVEPPEFPSGPKELTTIPARLLAALRDAADAADRTPVRYATDKVRLRGQDGSIAATNGRHLLVQTGFHLPWQEDVLVASLPIFGSRELPQDPPVEIGKTDDWVALAIGSWTIQLKIDRDGRFPRVEDLIPMADRAEATLELSADDAEFLAKTLPRLPGDTEPARPITIDCNGSTCIRSRADGPGRPTELVLARSSVMGQPVRFATDRQYLAHALKLGFLRLHFYGPNTPVLCQDEHRTYAWMRLSPEAIVAPSGDAIRITSDHAHPARSSASAPITKRRPVMSKSPSNGQSNGQRRGVSRTGERSILQLIEEADAIKSVLRDAYSRAHKLAVALKRHRKQTRLVQSTLASLRQLQSVDA